MELFAAQAVTLAALSARTLGWTPQTFWQATPAELAACLDTGNAAAMPPTRAQIAHMIERDGNGR